MAGFTPATRETIYARASRCCERCGVYAYGGSIHHRRPRGMGGSKDAAARGVPNGLLLCGSGTTGCHGWVETHRDESLAAGLLVRQGQDPADVPVEVFRLGLVHLTDEGMYDLTRAPMGARTEHQ